MKKILFCAVFLGLLMLMSAQEQPMRFSLEDCLKYAEEHNYTLQNAKLDQSVSEINYKQAKLQMSPTVSASASQGFSYSHSSMNGGADWTGNYGLSAGVTLFKGLNTFNTIKQRKLDITQNSLLFEQQKNQLNIQIVQAFLNILMNEELSVYQKEVINKSREQMQQGYQRYKVGQILESDYLLLQAQYVSDSVNYENTLLNLNNNYITLKALLAISPSTPIDIQKPDTSSMLKNLMIPSLQEVVDKAFDYLPELKYSQNRIESANYDVKIAKSSYYPSLSLNAGVSTGYSSNNGAFGTQLGDRLGENVGLSLNIPIYNQNRARASVKIAKIGVQQAENDLQEKQINILQDLEKYYVSVNEAENDYRVATIREKAYAANFEAYNMKFMYGTITAADLLTQQNNYLSALNTYMQNKYSFVLQRKILDIVMGVPVTL
ncbi:MAG: TolC family protein [Bacteroidales bacterium]|nr:TolC family protein [Bacteroidales bacterium]